MKALKNNKVTTVFLPLLLILAIFSCRDSNRESNLQVRQPQMLSAISVSIGLPFVNGPVIDYSGREASRRGRLLTSQQIWNLPVNYASLFSSMYVGYMGKNINSFPSFFPDYGAAYYSITYETVDPDGGIVTVSGAVWVPSKSGPLSLLTYCHGTNTGTDLSEGRIVPGLFAGKGYMSASPDYIGYGKSAGMDHPYLHASTLASSTVDIIRAAKKFAEYNSIPLNGKLFITGISEGGMAAMATVKEIQANYSAVHPITAAAPISGPYDISGTSAAYIVPNKNVRTGYLAFVIPIYNLIYGIGKPLSYYMKEPYATWFETDRLPRSDSSLILDDLPTNTSDLLTDGFLTSFTGAGEPEMKAAMQSNDTYKFVPTMYIKMYAAEADTTVPPSNAQTALSYFQSHGAPNAQVEILPASYGGHSESAIPILDRVIPWFSGF
ncbi:MAG: hypothetical protein MUD12_04050 [Spirochaetes bacterium]|nr:hypothetical protein [Spirochaetota bacterium]